MRRRSTVVAATACWAVSSVILAGCGSTSSNAGGRPTGAPPAVLSPSAVTSAVTNGAQPSAPPAPTASPTPAVKNVPAGNCTVYPKAEAVKLLGAVNMNNKNLDIGTDGGTKIDQCSYIDLKSLQDITGVSYAVVRYDSAATAFTEAKKVQTEMLGSAAGNNWQVQSLTAAVPGAGQVLGGYGTKSESGFTYTMAVVGTNVGPYLVAALGASSESPDGAKTLALTLFKALASEVG